MNYKICSICYIGPYDRMIEVFDVYGNSCGYIEICYPCLVSMGGLRENVPDKPWCDCNIEFSSWQKEVAHWLKVHASDDVEPVTLPSGAVIIKAKKNNQEEGNV